MAVPGFQELMLPVLQAVQDGKTYTNAQVNDRVAEALLLGPDDLVELLPSGGAKLFYNRCGWAKQYLVWAQCLIQPKRAQYTITDRGRQVLEACPQGVSVAYLKQFPELMAYLKPSKSSNGEDVDEPDEGDWASEKDPIELLESGYQQMRTQLTASLLQQVKSCSPSFFEQLVVDLLVTMGYGGSRKDAGQAVGGSGDGGIDGIIKEDPLGLEAVYIQAKRWQGSVG